MKLRCIAIDDEPLALIKIESFIKKIPYLEFVASFDSAIKALEKLRNTKTDLIFLDIQMKDLTGIQFIESLKSHPKIILTTAFDSYAVKAFELDVVDYLLKPISFERFLKAVEKVYADSDYAAPVETKSIPVETNGPGKFVFLKSGTRYVKILTDDIIYIEGMKDYLAIVTHEAKIPTLYNFSNIFEILPMQQFIRVHKSYIVALNKIDYIEKNYLIIKNKLITVSESYKEVFYQIIQERSIRQ